MDKVMIRSLMWPGYNFYHQTNSNRFGAIYIGDGQYQKKEKVRYLSGTASHQYLLKKMSDTMMS